MPQMGWLLPHRLSQAAWVFLVRDQEVVHAGSVIFFVLQDGFHHDAGGRILLAEVADQLEIMLDHQPLGDEVVLDICTRLPPSPYSVTARLAKPCGLKFGTSPS